ncbi:Ig-like domain-containing protein, partial [Desulfocucumis palustris]|uniref:Ig-like domain-containing protein n=1 Tax=Desulfocucumis palustris TaxID=1898651 RepID=UPI000F0B313A
FSFKVSTDKLNWLEGKNGLIAFISSETGKRLFYINPVYACDATGKEISGVTQTVRNHGGELFIDIELNKESLNNVTYPIYIDPTISIAPEEDEAMDTCINRNSSRPDGNGGLCVDRDRRTLVKYNLSAVPRGTIKSATLYIENHTPGQKLYSMRAYRVTQEWLEMEATWDEAEFDREWEQPGGTYDPSTGVSGNIDYDEYTMCYDASFNVTNMVDAWVNGTAPNYGLILCPYIENPENYDYSIFSHPKLSITYETDITEPAINITSPAKDSSNTGTVNMEATATDASGIQKVEFYVGSALIGTATGSPFKVNWDTTGFPDGSYKIWARSYDNAGNIGYTNYFRLCDTFDTKTKIDTGKTSAKYNTEGNVEFDSGDTTMESKSVSITEPVKNVYLEVNESRSNFTYYVSADGGANWQEITPRTVTTLQYPGNKLKFKAYTTKHDYLYDYLVLFEKTNGYTVNVNNPNTVSPPSDLTAQSAPDGSISLNWSP